MNPLPLLVLALATLASAQSSISPKQSRAWGANTGWIDARAITASAPAGAIVTETFLSGLIYSANCGWINLGDGSPANGVRYGNATGSDHGVNLHPDGTLTGMAWGANIGWITFEQNSGKPRIDYQNGAFSGRAWSANTGWIELGSGLLATTEIQLVDSDGDGLSDPWEMEHYGNLTDADPAADDDGDGSTNLAESQAGTDPGDAASSLKIVSLNISGGYALLTHTASANRYYQLQSSTDLAQWENLGGTFAAVAEPLSAIQILVDPDEPKRFWRIGAKMPLTP